jgi:signal transduction histidine kinase
MSLRWKLNASVLAMVASFLVAAGFSIRAVSRHGEYSRLHSRTRAQSQFTADVRALIFQHLAVAGGIIELPEQLSEESWPHFVIEDIDVQIRLAKNETEAELWTDLRAAIIQIASAEDAGEGRNELNLLAYQVELDLRRLRNYYEITENELIVRAAGSGLVEYVVLWIASIVMAVVLLLHLVTVREWMVKPVEVLRESIQKIAKGALDHRVPLKGTDELGDLARGIDSMATELAERQADLIEARELSAIGELCGNIAHGLRNPLATIRATAQLAGRRCEAGTPAAMMMLELTQQADRMDQRITRLFEFSRMVGLNRSATSFAEIAAQVQTHTAPMLHQNQMTLKIDDRTNDARWNVDSGQIVESLAELVGNAIHHSQPDSSVHLTGEMVRANNGTGPQLRIQVVDQGAGMDKDTVRKMFDPFFTSRPSGTGMGLALVRRIVERHGGHIDVGSALGDGTTISITLHGARSEPADATHAETTPT